MLDVLRANKNSVLTWVILVAIAVVFVVAFGPGTRGFTDSSVRSASFAAQVNGRTITAADFEQHYGQLFRLYRQRAGQALTREMADQLGLRSLAMNQLVERELVAAEAELQGLRVSDQDLDRAVKEMPGFRTARGFDLDLYKQATASAYGSPAKFEGRLRRELASQKLVALVRRAAQVSEDEAREAWLAQSDRVDLVIVRFPVAVARAEVKVSDAEVRAFLAANPQRVEQFYRDNPGRYQKKTRVRARHILSKVPETAPAAEDQAARRKIEILAERLKKGGDFAAIAGEASDDPGSKDRGGDVGFFGEGIMAKPFEDAAFALGPGQVSGPVRTRFGWHLIRVEEVQPAETVPLDQARSSIARELVEAEAARALVQRRAEAALAAARGGKRLADLFPAAKPGREPVKLGGTAIVAEETGPFSPSVEYVPRAGAVVGLAAEAGRAQAGQTLPRVFQAADAAVVAQVKERQRPDPALFAAKKDEVTQQVRAGREAQIEAAWLKQLHQKAEVRVNEAFLRGEVAAPPVDLE